MTRTPPPSMDSAPTIRDVATAAGVSKTTVGEALHDSPKVAPATRQRIRQIAREMGYRPDPGLRCLAERRWPREALRHGLGVVFLNDLKSKRLGGYVRIWKGIQSAATDLGYVASSIDLFEIESERRLTEILLARGTAGLIFGPFSQSHWGDKFDWGQFPAIGCSFGSFVPPLNLISFDVTRIVRQVWETCLARGYRRIGFVFLKPLALLTDQEFSRRACHYYLNRAQEPHAEGIPPLEIKGTNADTEDLLPWLERYQPDVVVGANNSVYWILRNGGFRIPTDVAFCSMNTWTGEPEVTGFNILREHIGSAAMIQLDAMIRANRRGLPDHQMIQLLEPEWIEGQSLPTLRPNGRRRSAPKRKSEKKAKDKS